MIQRNEKIAHSLARAIVSQVASANLPAGSVLASEAEMMERYGVSRGSLRESLRILEVLGFIQMKPGPRGGPVLRDPQSRQFSTIATLYYQRINATYRELLETRLTLEPTAAALAAERRSEEHVAMLNEYLERSRDADLEDDREFRAIGQGFHDLVAEMSGNKVVNLLIRSCYDVFAGRTSGYLYPREDREAIAAVHERIAKAVIAGNAGRAHSLMEGHMEDYVAQATRQFSGLMSEVVKW